MSCGDAGWKRRLGSDSNDESPQFCKGVARRTGDAGSRRAGGSSPTTGLPTLTIKDVKVITTSGGANYRWVFLKIITSEPGLYGIGSANNHYQTTAVIAALENHLKPWLIGKDPDQIEDLWQSSHLKTYWRNGPVNNNVLAAMDMALWDIKGKRAGMPVYELLGGKVRDAVPCYDHAAGNDAAAAIDSVQKSMAAGYRHIRVQFGGYGGGGFHSARSGEPARGRTTGSGVRRRAVCRTSAARCSSRCAPRSEFRRSSATTFIRT